MDDDQALKAAIGIARALQHIGAKYPSGTTVVVRNANDDIVGQVPV